MNDEPLRKLIVATINNSCDDANNGCSRATIINTFSNKSQIFKNLSIYEEEEIEKVIDELIEEGFVTQGPIKNSYWLVVTNKKPDIAKALKKRNEKRLKLLLT